MTEIEPQAPAVLATRNPDATMHLASLAWKPLPDGTLLLECGQSSVTVENLKRDSFCWVVVHQGRLPAQSPDDSTEVHLVGRGHIEPADNPDQWGREVIRFCPSG